MSMMDNARVVRDERPRIGMAVYGDLTFDSRVRREASTLARAGYNVTILCLADDSTATDLPENVRVLVHRPTSTSVLPRTSNPFFETQKGRMPGPVRRLGWLRGYIANVRAWGQWAVKACAGAVDVWHLHDLPALAAVLPALDGRVPVVYDSHELFLETGTALKLPKPARMLLRAYERRLVSRVSAVVTVNDALAKVLHRRYRPKRVVVLHNCPDRWSPPASRSKLLREAAGIPADEPVILYHGNLGSHRGIEQLMRALLEPGMERAHLALLGFGEKRDDYFHASTSEGWRGRVHVLDPVPASTLPEWVASADVGAMPIQASTLNHYLSTPNKLFESLAAGVPVVASDFPTMRRIVIDGPTGALGAVCDPSRVEEVTAALRGILELDPPAAEALRARCLAAAWDRWNWEVESRALIGLYEDLAREPGLGAAASRPRSTR